MSRPWIRSISLLLLLALGAQLAACGIPPEHIGVVDGAPPRCDPPLAEGDFVLVKLRDGTELKPDRVHSWDRNSLTLSDTTLAWTEVREIQRLNDRKASSTNGAVEWIILGVFVVGMLALLVDEFMKGPGESLGD